jgi:subtilisin family serine protease
VHILDQIKNGATIINYSQGPPYPDQLEKGYSDVCRRFMGALAKAHPEVLFVAAAGNEGNLKVGLDGENYGFGGLDLPNVITVGALDGDGKRVGFSNYAAQGGEVTLSAQGQSVPVGVGTDGKVVTANGTSFATPQVTSAAAIMRSINPNLTAAEIKEILVESATAEVATGSRIQDVDESVGGRVLRVDNAVLKVINGMRPKNDQLDRATLDKMCAIDAVAIPNGGRDYTIKATLGAVGSKGTDVTIDLNGSFTTGLTKRHIGKAGELTWPFMLSSENEGATLKLRRLDTGACCTIRLASTSQTPPVATPVEDDSCTGVTVADFRSGKSTRIKLLGCGMVCDSSLSDSELASCIAAHSKK